jgi:UDP-N-acetylmuramate dehydrogenase
MQNIQQDFLLSNITTLKIGGPAKQYTVVKNTEDLINIIKDSKNKGERFLVVGGGSNLLISDDGVNKLVIKNETDNIQKSGNVVTAKSGTGLQTLVDFTITNGFSGMQKLTGIPGTVGGAVYGNAAAYGQTISDNVTEVVCFDGQNKKSLSKKECLFNYRDSGFKKNGLVILEVRFQFPLGEPDELKKESEEILEKRLQKYKPGVLCPGSFFKNILIEKLTPEQKKLIPEDRDYYGKVPAWFFLDSVGAKGDKLGQIKIADFHGNLFMNEGDGKAADFYKLAKKYYKKVEEKFGVKLEPEVQLINLPPFSVG